MEDIFEIHTLNLKRNYDDGDAEDVADDDSDVDVDDEDDDDDDDDDDNEGFG